MNNPSSISFLGYAVRITDRKCVHLCVFVVVVVVAALELQLCLVHSVDCSPQNRLFQNYPRLDYESLRMLFKLFYASV